MSAPMISTLILLAITVITVAVIIIIIKWASKLIKSVESIDKKLK